VSPHQVTAILTTTIQPRRHQALRSLIVVSRAGLGDAFGTAAKSISRPSRSRVTAVAQRLANPAPSNIPTVLPVRCIPELAATAPKPDHSPDRPTSRSRPFPRTPAADHQHQRSIAISGRGICDGPTGCSIPEAPAVFRRIHSMWLYPTQKLASIYRRRHPHLRKDIGTKTRSPKVASTPVIVRAKQRPAFGRLVSGAAVVHGKVTSKIETGQHYFGGAARWRSRACVNAGSSVRVIAWGAYQHDRPVSFWHPSTSHFGTFERARSGAGGKLNPPPSPAVNRSKGGRVICHRDLSRGFLRSSDLGPKVDPHLLDRGLAGASEKGFGTGDRPTLMSTFIKSVKADLQAIPRARANRIQASSVPPHLALGKDRGRPSVSFINTSSARLRGDRGAW